MKELKPGDRIAFFGGLGGGKSLWSRAFYDFFTKACIVSAVTYHRPLPDSFVALDECSYTELRNPSFHDMKRDKFLAQQNKPKHEPSGLIKALVKRV